MLIILLIFMALFSFKAKAQIFEYQRSNGSVAYSDQIPNNVATQTIRPIIQKTKDSIFFGEPKRIIEDDTKQISATKEQAIDFSITTPTEQQKFSDSTIDIKFTLFPPLQIQQKIQILLDGQPYQAPSKSLQITLEHLSPGSHFVVAQLLSEHQEVLKTTSKVTFYTIPKA